MQKQMFLHFIKFTKDLRTCREQFFYFIRQYCQPHLGFWGKETSMDNATVTGYKGIFRAGNAKGVQIGDGVHILKRSSSRFHLEGGGSREQYVCQDGCCDCGLMPDVSKVVMQAKEAGATKVFLRTGQRSYRLAEIHGLPVHCVSYAQEELAEGWRIVRAW